MRESLEDFLSPEEEQQIIDAIREAELQTSGEIRVHLERSCHGNPMKRAQEVFSILDMQNTRLQNAVLIYLAVADHRFAICGDIGIDTKVGSEFWSEAKALLGSRFQIGDFAGGLSDAITLVGKQLKTYFPRMTSDDNELPDSISKS